VERNDFVEQDLSTLMNLAEALKFCDQLQDTAMTQSGTTLNVKADTDCLVESIELVLA
jgi:hypothetical protein